MYVCVCVCVYICMYYVCMYVGMCVYVYVCMYVLGNFFYYLFIACPITTVILHAYLLGLFTMLLIYSNSKEI
jgi:hypothetical protein